MSRPALFAVLLLVLAAPGPAPAESSRSVLDLEAKRLGGPVEALSRYRGNVVLIVNTASRCGLTPQYDGLQALYERYRERGFTILGFPSNDFAGQEPGSDAEIGAFCRSNYGVGFPMFSKVRVTGDEAHPVYAYLTGLPAPLGGDVEWNFQKYLVDRSGQVHSRHAPRQRPEALTDAIEALLAAPVPAEKTRAPR